MHVHYRKKLGNLLKQIWKARNKVKMVNLDKMYNTCLTRFWKNIYDKMKQVNYSL